MEELESLRREVAMLRATVARLRGRGIPVTPRRSSSDEYRHVPLAAAGS
jgi:hypothetical protein